MFGVDDYMVYIEYSELDNGEWCKVKKYFTSLEEARQELVNFRKLDSDAILYHTCTDKNSPFYGLLIWDW